MAIFASERAFSQRTGILGKNPQPKNLKKVPETFQESVRKNSKKFQEKFS
jgi:hypothetical protein